MCFGWWTSTAKPGRVIPGIRVDCWRETVQGERLRIIEAKYGKQLQSAFQLPDGDLLHECFDDLSNEAYQRLLRLPRGAPPGNGSRA